LSFGGPFYQKFYPKIVIADPGFPRKAAAGSE